MRVLHFTTVFSRITQTFVYDTIMLLQNAGLENHVVTLSRENKSQRPFKDVYPLLGDYKDRTYSFNIFSQKFWSLLLQNPLHFLIKLFKISLPCFYIFFLKRRIKMLLAQIKPDIIQCHFGWGFYELYKILGVDCFDYPLVVSFHGTDILLRLGKDRPYSKALLNAFRSKRVYFTVNSEYLKSASISRGIEESKIAVIYNSVNPMFLKYRKAPFFISQMAPKIICIGRFIPLKGHKYLIEAFAKLNKDFPMSTLSLVGSGDLKKAIIQQIKELGLEERINFLGDIQHSHIPHILNQHDVYVQPSVQDPITKQAEAFGVSILEAIVIGLPVIATQTGGIPETVGKEYLNTFVHLIPERNSQAIYDKMKQLSCSNQIQNNSEYVTNRLKYFSNEAYVKRLKEIFIKAVSRP